jgi:hypothetical protein
VVGEHGPVAAVAVGVRRGAAEDLDPPVGHLAPVVLADATREQGRQQLVSLDAVVEGVDELAER